jgi:hypothetical protein
MMLRPVLVLLATMVVGCKPPQTSVSTADQGASQSSGKTIFSGEPIPVSCVKDYENGIKLFESTKGDTEPTKKWEAAIEQVAKECRFYFSMGIFDAKEIANQRTILEYIFEYDYEREANQPAVVLQKITARYTKALGSSAQLLNAFKPGSETWVNAKSKISQNLKALAREERKAVLFGDRFVFTSGGPEFAMTTVDYEYDGSGNIIRQADGTPKSKEGGYVQRVDRFLKMAVEVLEEYRKWQPGYIYGEDSFLYGSFWKAIGLDDTPTSRKTRC